MIAGIATDFVRHDESIAQARSAPGVFTILAHTGAVLTGYSVWRLAGDALMTGPWRHWGACRHGARAMFRLALDEGRRRGANACVAWTWLAPATVRRWLGVEAVHAGDLWEAS